jgi:hypothetical protein
MNRFFEAQMQEFTVFHDFPVFQLDYMLIMCKKLYDEGLKYPKKIHFAMPLSVWMLTGYVGHHDFSDPADERILCSHVYGTKGCMYLFIYLLDDATIGTTIKYVKSTFTS